jgi:hypothetical protein
VSESKDDLTEETLHDLLETHEPSCASLLHAIRSYEAFARALQDAFDLLRAVATTLDSRGFEITNIATDSDFQRCVENLHQRFATAHRALSEVTITNLSLQNLFDSRFGAFAERLDASACALVLCTHHEKIQRGKSAAGKRPWFDRLSDRRIYLRHAYREKRRDIQPEHYVHVYRSRPIRNFFYDLT